MENRYKLILPPLVLLIILGVVLGNLLYFIEPNRGHKRAMFHQLRLCLVKWA